MKEEMKGIYWAVILSIAVIFITNYFFPRKEVTSPTTPEIPVVETTAEKDIQQIDDNISEKPLEVSDVLNKDARIKVNNTAISGSIRIKGARFDEILLNKYKQTLEADSSDVELFAPTQTASPYYAEFGWLPQDTSIRTPNADTLWTVKGKELTPQTSITLKWDNGQGLTFIRRISLDDNYMFNIEQSVENNTNNNIVLYPYGLISRFHNQSAASSVVHEGLIGVVDNNLKEIKYKDIKDNKKEDFKTTGGWAGFSDRYWFSAFVMNNTQKGTIKFSNTGKDTYQVDYVGTPITIASGSIATNTIKMFTGAKEIKLLDNYTKQFNIPKFDLAVDFGWYYFLTKPFFYILDFLYNFIGNMGWAILLFAALLRFLMFPVANKSFESMSKMKKVQPKIKELQERYGDDKMKLQQETLELYRREKINPAAGCLPMLIQIPVFFSLYKVLNISIEIRHAPFIGWIKDLSAPDPLTISTWTHLPVPGLIDIGVWPILMGLTMWFQQKLNPAPTNKDQARMFAMMPIIFTFMLGHFASGLVIYWTLSNILSIVQQKAIMKKNGVK